MLLFYTFIGILALIVLIAFLKFDTFISFILVSIGLGFAAGMDITAIGKSIQTGIGGTLGDLILIIGFGAMLGKLVAESGAAQRITDTLMKIFGKQYIQWGLALAGFIIGIPLFYNAGFIIVVPLIFTIAAATEMPLMFVAIPMLSALSVAHGFLPPHPSPAAIASQLKADVGRVLIYGIIIAIPSIIIAGVFFGRTLKKYKPVIDTSLFKIKRLSDSEMPSLFISLVVALMPVLILTITAVLKGQLPDNQVVRFLIHTNIGRLFVVLKEQLSESLIIKLLAEPYIGMLVSVLFAMYFLGIARGSSMKNVTKQLEEAFKSSSVILLIIAGAGALKQVLKDSGTSDYIGSLLQNVDVNPLILGWLIAAVLRLCVGSATVAGLTAVGIIAPMVATMTGIKPELMVLSVGAGSLLFSHLNDGGFWLFKEYFNLTIKETILTWSIMETIVSVVGLIGVLILDMFV
jgi:Gnt-I system high-affinity gluconate transporter